MRLRNKKTGEIRELPDGFFCGDNLKKICEEWEDYEEPKERHYYIEPRGQVIKLEFGDDVDVLKEELSEIGNYFETKEEAERAVEKLKAWKWLKDKGFRFTGVDDVERAIRFEIPFRTGYDSCEAEADLDLLFGGEE